MAALTEDTLYFRHDHPRGFLFGAGEPEPSADEGWAKSADEIGEAPARTFECTTFEAYEELLKSERASKAQLMANVETMTAQRDEARAQFVRLTEAVRAAQQAPSAEA